MQAMLDLCARALASPRERLRLTLPTEAEAVRLQRRLASTMARWACLRPTSRYWHPDKAVYGRLLGVWRSGRTVELGVVHPRDLGLPGEYTDDDLARLIDAAASGDLA